MVSQKAGLAPTGILANAAKALGFASVDALLKVNPEAAQISLAGSKPSAKATQEPQLAGPSQVGLPPIPRGVNIVLCIACQDQECPEITTKYYCSVKWVASFAHAL